MLEYIVPSLTSQLDIQKTRQICVFKSIYWHSKNAEFLINYWVFWGDVELYSSMYYNNKLLIQAISFPLICCTFIIIDGNIGHFTCIKWSQDDAMHSESVDHALCSQLLCLISHRIYDNAYFHCNTVNLVSHLGWFVYEPHSTKLVFRSKK